MTTVHTTPLSAEEIEALKRTIRISRRRIKELLDQDPQLRLTLDGIPVFLDPGSKVLNPTNGQALTYEQARGIQLKKHQEEITDALLTLESHGAIPLLSEIQG